MTFHETKNGYVVVLQKGELLVESLLEFAGKANLNSAWVNGIGAVLGAELGYYDLPGQQYQWHKLEKTLEIVSLSGNLTVADAKPFWHLHVVLSDPDLATVGGHLKEATVGGTCELYVTPLGVDLQRQLDAETGLKLIK